jgi:hypothetical protein
MSLELLKESSSVIAIPRIVEKFLNCASGQTRHWHVQSWTLMLGSEHSMPWFESARDLIKLVCEHPLSGPVLCRRYGVTASSTLPSTQISLPSWKADLGRGECDAAHGPQRPPPDPAGSLVPARVGDKFPAHSRFGGLLSTFVKGILATGSGWVPAADRAAFGIPLVVPPQKRAVGVYPHQASFALRPLCLTVAFPEGHGPWCECRYHI